MARIKSIFIFSLGVIATLVGIYIALIVYAKLLLRDCTVTADQALSPSGEYVAVFQQTTCKSFDKNRSDVYLAKRGVRARNVILEIHDKSAVTLLWRRENELVVSYPEGAAVERLNTLPGWPGVTFLQSAK